MNSRRRIFVIATDSAGCWYYRLHLPLTHLDPERWEVVWRGPDVGELVAGDVVIGQRLASVIPDWEYIGGRGGVTAVYDLDDDLMHVDPTNTVPYGLYGQQSVIDAIKHNIEVADVVTVSTANLADVVREINPNVVVLQNCIAADSALMHERTDLPTIGWAGSMFHAQDWTDGDRAALQSIWEKFAPGVAFRTIGADYMGIPNRHTGWSTMDNYWRSLDFDIGIAPLADTPFNHCKSWIKALEYMARGIVPVVPTIGQYPELIDSGRNGLTYWPAEPGMNALQWTLEWLLGHQDEMADMQARALDTAAQWTIDKQAHRWDAVYSQEWAS